MAIDQAVEADAAENETADGESLAGGSDGGDVSGSESVMGSSYSGGLSGGSAFLGGACRDCQPESIYMAAHRCCWSAQYHILLLQRQHGYTLDTCERLQQAMVPAGWAFAFANVPLMSVLGSCSDAEAQNVYVSLGPE